MKILDLAWGHPGYLAEYWELLNEYSYLGYEIGNQYELDGGIDILKDAIYNLHLTENNADVKDKHIVIGNGATQVLRCLLKIFRPSNLKVPVPYYAGFPRMAEEIGASYNADHGEREVAIITNPNNPTCTTFSGHIFDVNTIFDHCYNWSQYGPIIKKSDEDIMVNSLSKATGHPGIRIGWALIRDDDLATSLTKEIASETCGVSIPSQLMAVNIINSQLSKPRKEQCFWHGRYELKYRWAMMKKTLGHAKELDPINRLGMFVVFKVDSDKKSASDHFLSKYGVKTVCGEKIGLDNSHVRVNIGGNAEDFKKLIERLSGTIIYEADQS